MHNFFISRLFLFALMVLSGCGKEEEVQQNSLADTKATDVIFLDTTNIPFDIVLKRETVFESNEEVFFEGYIGEIAVDNNDRVYITATKPGTISIYVFDPEGSFITKFGQEGRGPGEFESISSLSIQGNELYVLGPRLQKFGVFSLDDFQLIRGQIIRRDSIPKHDELARILRVNELLVTESGEIIAKMSNLSLRKENEINKIRYHKISHDGYILPDRILELEKFHSYFSKHSRLPRFMPFARNSLAGMLNDGSFYTAWSEDFIIKKYDQKGQYVQSFQFSYENAPLYESELSLFEPQRKILSEIDVPETWQALHSMVTDDENRLWVSTITENDNVFQWWVIDEEGDVLAVFNRARKLTNPLSVLMKPLYSIKNGYFYEPERDEYDGIIRIIKHKIEFVKR